MAVVSVILPGMDGKITFNRFHGSTFVPLWDEGTTLNSQSLIGAPGFRAGPTPRLESALIALIIQIKSQRGLIAN